MFSTSGKQRKPQQTSASTLLSAKEWLDAEASELIDRTPPEIRRVDVLLNESLETWLKNSKKVFSEDIYLVDLAIGGDPYAKSRQAT
jgi:hypothetical protein